MNGAAKKMTLRDRLACRRLGQPYFSNAAFVSIALFALEGCAESRVAPEMAEVDAGDAFDANAPPMRRGGPTDGAIRYDVYVDPGCDAGDRAMRSDIECDVYDPDACGPGLSCYPSVGYPEGPCGEEVFSTFCAVTGPAREADHCLDTLDCGAGLSCFVTGAGNQCLRLCNLGGGEPSCPRGTICTFTDLADYGACF